MKTSIRVLLIEDSEDDAALLLKDIDRSGYEPIHTRVDSLEALKHELQHQEWDVIISDYDLPGFSGMDALHLVRQHDADLPFIIVSGNIGEDTAIEAMHAGGHAYVWKNNLSRLGPAIERALREITVVRAGRQAQNALQENEERLHALVSNIPGVVLQLFRDWHGGYSFPYVSSGSMALLELSPRQLQDDAELFFSVLADDEGAEFKRLLGRSAEELTAVNWEGKIRTPTSESLKWANVRLSPRRIDGSRVQWEGIMMNVSRQKQAEIEITQSRQHLSELSSHLERAKELERTRVAREVHDDIGGNLTAMKIDLMWMLSRLMKQGSEELQNKTNALIALTDRTMETTSRIARDLRPPLLDLGLPAAIEWEAKEFEERMEIRCNVRIIPEDIHVNSELSTAVFGVFRETLTNISKHAKATRVKVELGANEHMLTLKVSDNGSGILESDLRKRGSFGLRGMTERVRHLCGTIAFKGKPGRGTTIIATFPLDGDATPPRKAISSVLEP